MGGEHGLARCGDEIAGRTVLDLLAHLDQTAHRQRRPDRLFPVGLGINEGARHNDAMGRGADIAQIRFADIAAIAVSVGLNPCPAIGALEDLHGLTAQDLRIHAGACIRRAMNGNDGLKRLSGVARNKATGLDLSFQPFVGEIVSENIEAVVEHGFPQDCAFDGHVAQRR